MGQRFARLNQNEILMGSKMIFDAPELLAETLITLSAACECFPVKCSRPTLERWLRQGSRGTILESILICGKRYTSQEAIDRFVRGQLRVEADRPAPKRGNKSKKDIEAAARRFGLPEPLCEMFPQSALDKERGQR
jgi:hypothetical protein